MNVNEVDKLSCAYLEFVGGPLLRLLCDWPISDRFKLPCESIQDGHSRVPSDASGKYARLHPQCRHIFALLEASDLSPDAKLKDRARSLATHFFELVQTMFTNSCEHFGWRFALGETANEKLTSDCRHLYAHAFVILAGSAVYKHLGLQAGNDIALKTLNFVEDKFRLGNGGFATALDKNLDIINLPREQNPHMHLLEACIFAFESSSNQKFLSVAEKIIALWSTSWTVGGYLTEYFNSNWQPDIDHCDSLEAGHHFEWIWLIERWIRLNDSSVKLSQSNSATAATLRVLSNSLLSFAVSKALDSKNGGYFDVVSRQGHVKTNSKRIWPLCEALKAFHFARNIEGYLLPQLETASQACNLLLERYLKSNGDWVESYHADFQSIHRSELPLSTPYHLVMAAREINMLQKCNVTPR